MPTAELLDAFSSEPWGRVGEGGENPYFKHLSIYPTHRKAAQPCQEALLVPGTNYKGRWK